MTVSDDTLAVARDSEFLQTRELPRELLVPLEDQQLDGEEPLPTSCFDEGIADAWSVSVFAFVDVNALLELLVELPPMSTGQRVEEIIWCNDVLDCQALRLARL